METQVKKSVYQGLFLTCILMLSSFLAKADASKLNKTLTSDLSKDGAIGYYIIGGILGFGIIAFIIVTIYDKKHEHDDDNHNSNIKHMAHHKHHHHHHRVIKKSA